MRLVFLRLLSAAGLPFEVEGPIWEGRDEPWHDTFLGGLLHFLRAFHVCFLTRDTQYHSITPTPD